MEKEGMSFVTIDADGNEMECEALFTFDSEETGKGYMVYTDNTVDEEGNTKVYASIYEPEGENGFLQPIESDKEWQIVETIFKEINEEISLDKEGDEQ